MTNGIHNTIKTAMKPLHISFLISILINFFLLLIISNLISSTPNKSDTLPIMIDVIRVTPSTTEQSFNNAPLPSYKTENLKRYQKITTTIVSKEAVTEQPPVEPLQPIANQEMPKETPDQKILQEQVDTLLQKEIIDIVDTNKNDYTTIPSAEKSNTTAVVETASTEKEPVTVEEPIDIEIEERVANEEPFIDKLPEEYVVPINRLTRIPVVKGAITPIYPDRARMLNKEGMVQLEALIDSTGLVIAVKVLKGGEFGFDEAAVEAVKQARFEPAMINEKPVPVRVTIPIKFELQ